MSEETQEFEQAFEDKLEELFGFEFEINSVNHQVKQGRVNVHAQPTGTEDILEDEFEDVGVKTGSGLTFYFHV